jgi:hypothetical protein
MASSTADLRVAIGDAVERPNPSGIHPVAEDPAESAAEARIREITAQLKGSVVEAGIQYHAQIGAIVVGLLYGGNLAAWRRRRSADPSMKRLARRLAEIIPSTSLFRSLSIYELLLTHAVAIPQMRTLGVRVLASIASAPTLAQPSLIESALQQQWTAAQTQERVSLLPRRSKGGRRPKPALLRTLAKITQLGNQLGGDLATLDLATLRQCIEEGAAAATDLERVLERLQDELAAREDEVHSTRGMTRPLKITKERK